MCVLGVLLLSPLDKYPHLQLQHMPALLEYYRREIYRLKVPLPVTYNYVEDFIIDALILGICFPPESGVTCVGDPEFAITLPIVNYSQMFHTGRRAWFQVMLVLLAMHRELNWGGSVCQPEDPPST